MTRKNRPDGEMSKGQRRRAEARAAREKKDMPLYKRREFLITSAGISVAGGIAALMNVRPDPNNEHAEATEVVDFDAIVESLSKYGTIVFDEANPNPKHLQVILKQYHGGRESAIHMASDPSYRANFVAHHDRLTAIVTDALTTYGPQQVHTLIESQDMPGRKSEWSHRVRETLEMMSDDQVYERVRQQSFAQTMQGNPQGALASVGLIHASMQIAIACERNPEWQNAVDGADPRNHFSLSQKTHSLLEEFLHEYENPTDDELQTFLHSIRQIHLEDFEKRHEYIRNESERVTPEGGVTYHILGAAHMKSGEQMLEKETETPLENYLLSLPQTRVVVLDEQNLSPLLRYENPHADATLKVDFTNMTMEQLKNILPILRAQKRGR